MEFKERSAFYTVGTNKFYSKSLALIEATKTNIHPEWHFGNGVFDTVDWSKPVDSDINSVYKARAKQLREKYDYLVLCFSGGSDSTTILQSFLSQNLLIDEVLVKWPIKATQGLYKPSTLKTPENMLSEWDLSIKPQLEYLSIHYPTINITIQDWSDDIEKELVEEDWFSINDHLNPGVFRKYGGLTATESESAMIDKGKTTAVIWGIDKPQMMYKDGNIYLYFLDKFVNFAFISGTANRNVELFYWTPDYTDLIKTQARLVYEYFVRNPKMVSIIDWDNRQKNDRTTYNDIVRSIIYPNWNKGIFQCGKPTQIVKCEYDSWMFQHLGNYRYLQSWEHGLNNIRNVIDKKYYQLGKHGQFDGWVGFISPFYKIGPVHQVDNNFII